MAFGSFPHASPQSRWLFFFVRKYKCHISRLSENGSDVPHILLLTELDKKKSLLLTAW